MALNGTEGETDTASGPWSIIGAARADALTSFLDARRSLQARAMFPSVSSLIRSTWSMPCANRLFSTTSITQAGYKLKSHSGAKKRWKSLGGSSKLKRVSIIFRWASAIPSSFWNHRERRDTCISTPSRRPLQKISYARPLILRDTRQ